jgi:hypothetical protein
MYQFYYNFILFYLNNHKQTTLNKLVNHFSLKNNWQQQSDTHQQGRINHLLGPGAEILYGPF